MKELFEVLNKPLEGILTQEEQDELFVKLKRYSLIIDLLDTFFSSPNDRQYKLKEALVVEAAFCEERINELNNKK